MASAQAISGYRKTQADIVRLAERELSNFWKSLDFSDATKVARALEVFMPALIQQYGEIGASVARDFYDELRSNASTKKVYRSIMGNAVPTEAIQANTRWAVTPLFQKDSDHGAAFATLALVLDRAVKQTARNTIQENVQRDPARVLFARVPTGAETCAFCLVLASNGAVYLTKASAGEFNKYHGKCDCVPTPVWEGDDLPEGYDPDGLHAMYSNALKESDSNRLKGSNGVLSALREQQGIS